MWLLLIDGKEETFDFLNKVVSQNLTYFLLLDSPSCHCLNQTMEYLIQDFQIKEVKPK